MVKTLLKYSIPLVMVIAIAVMLWPAGGALAAPLGEGPAGQITDLKLMNAGQLAYMAEDTLTISLTATNNGSVRVEYRASLAIIDPDGGIAYDSGSQGDDREFPLNPGEAATVFFSWAVQRNSPAGTYIVAARLRDHSDSSILFDENSGGVTFEVLRQPRLALQRSSWDFGNVLPGATPELRIGVSNANPDAGTLLWQVTGRPLWIDILSPTGQVLGPGSIHLRVNASASVGQNSGDVVVSSNGGPETIAFAVFVEGNSSGEITSLNLTEAEYMQTESAEINVGVANDGDFTQDYRVVINITGPAGTTVYNSNEENEDRIVSIRAGSSKTASFLWEIPHSALLGEYTVGAALRNASSFGDLFDERLSSPAAAFEVIRGPVLSVSPDSTDFGDIKRGDRPARNFVVSNRGRGILTWHVADWPTWIDIQDFGSGFETGAFTIQLSEFAPDGEQEGAIEVASNANSVTIAVRANILTTPTPTPTQTGTPTPTSTPRPTRTPRPEGANQPSQGGIQTPTRTPIQALPPSPTPASLPPLATRTPTPTGTPVPAARPSPTATPLTLAAGSPTGTPTPNPSPTPFGVIVLDAPSGGSCFASPGSASASTSAANAVLLLGPAAMVAGMRRWRGRNR